MPEFEPSVEFVANVMRAVDAADVAAARARPAALRIASLPAARAALAAGGGLLGVLNLLRLWFTVFSPAICQ